MLHKVIKKMKEDEKESASVDSVFYQKKQNLNLNSGGFHAKKNSQAGADRQRSMGNRNTKPPR